jgi:bis(5'-nucleosidyl)-tetraphosphatase
MKIDHRWYHRPPGLRESLSAGGVVVRWEGERLLVALVREKDYLDYILPKGTVEAGENLQQTARREIMEEAGLGELILLGEIGVRERLNARGSSWKITHYFLFYSTGKETSPTDTKHIYRCEWFPTTALPSMFWPDQKELIQSNLEKILSLAQPFRRD